MILLMLAWNTTDDLLDIGSDALDLFLGNPPRPQGGRNVVGVVGETGTQIANAAVALRTDQERQQAIVDEILSGNLPPGSLRWKPVQYTAKDADGVEHTVIVSVAPNYLSVGTAADNLVAVLGLPLASEVAHKVGFLLPTPKIVDEVWKAAPFKYEPAPLPPTPGSEMRKPPYWLKSRDAILAQGNPPAGTLVAGHKKDVVATLKLIGNPGRLAIYGWHKADGKVIQGVSLFHGQDYADYSHGVRPVHPVMSVDGQRLNYRDVLLDPTLFKLVSNEAAPFDLADIMAPSDHWNMV